MWQHGTARSMRPRSHDDKILSGEHCLWMDGPRLPGGEGGIRTHDRVAPTPVFKTGAFNRSATSPQSIQWRGLILSGHGHRSGARTGRSGDATAPLALLVGDPDSGIFQFARFVIE